MGTGRIRARCLEQVRAIANSGTDPGELIEEAAGHLRRAIGFDGCCWLTADPTSTLSTAHIADSDLPFARAVPRLIARINQRPREEPRPPQAPSTVRLAADGDLSRSELWQECMRPYGMGDALSVPCADQYGTWGRFNAQLASDARPFSDDAVQLLSQASTSLGRILRLALRPPRGVDPGPRLRAPAVLILDEELRLRSWTPAAGEWLDVFPDGQLARGWSQLPSAIYAAAGQLLGSSADQCARGRVRMTDEGWAAVDGARLEGSAGGELAITIRAATAEETFGILARVYALTCRETEIATGLIDGLTSRQIAERLRITPHTVNDHVKSIFAKVGVTTRGELASRLTGRSVHDPGDRA